MNTKAQYYPKEELNLKPVVDGAGMWGVALENTLLTYRVPIATVMRQQMEILSLEATDSRKRLLRFWGDE